MGKWRVEYFGSGTVNATMGEPGFPWLNVGYSSTCKVSEDERATIAQDIASAFNTGEPPIWSSTMKRVTPSVVRVGKKGVVVTAVGPCYQSEPGRGDWTTDPSDDGLRRSMIDALFKFLRTFSDEAVSPDRRDEA